MLYSNSRKSDGLRSKTHELPLQKVPAPDEHTSPHITSVWGGE